MVPGILDPSRPCPVAHRTPLLGGETEWSYDQTEEVQEWGDAGEYKMEALPDVDLGGTPQPPPEHPPTHTEILPRAILKRRGGGGIDGYRVGSLGCGALL